MKILRIPLVIVLIVVTGRTFNANAQTETTLYSFAGYPNDGANPYAGLVHGSDGNFYGTTVAGGTNGDGTVFRISPGGSYTNLYSFAGYPNDGNGPSAGLVQGSDSNFYGTTFYGGASGYGTVFRISPGGSYTNLYSFAGYPNDGANPVAGLVHGSDGSFYGTTESGGTNDYGTVFRISPGGSYTNLYSFAGSPNDGESPSAGLVLGSDGNFYGTAFYGGTSGYGTVFRISPGGSHTNLYSFTGAPSDGALPLATLVQGSDGNFYGTTYQGGTNFCDCGTVFRISPSGSYRNLYSFADVPDGSLPYAGLAQGSDGNFYGTTLYGGGTSDYGTVFRISPGGSYTNLYSFGSSPADGEDGANPRDELVQGSDGNFYGTTYQGGTYKYGTVFKLAAGGGGGEGCTLILSARSVTLPAKGGSRIVRVRTTGTNCAWTAVSNDPFITITRGANGVGIGTVWFTIPGNTNTTAVSGTMSIAGQTLTVHQKAGGCTFSLSPKDQNFKAAGGSATVNVLPNYSDCAWTAVSTNSFITITDGLSGVGKGPVRYTVAPNTSTNGLTGTISIAGETFKVTQSGEK